MVNQILSSPSPNDEDFIPIENGSVEFDDSIEQYFTPDDAISDDNSLPKPALCITFYDSSEDTNHNEDRIQYPFAPNIVPAFSMSFSDQSDFTSSPHSSLGSNDFNRSIFQNAVENELLDENVLNQYGYFTMSLNTLAEDTLPINEKIELLKDQAAEKGKQVIQTPFKQQNLDGAEPSQPKKHKL